jgi:cell division protein YceG involved in septum cleavage
LDYKQLTQEVAAGSAPVKAALAKSKKPPHLSRARGIFMPETYYFSRPASVAEAIDASPKLTTHLISPSQEARNEASAKVTVATAVQTMFKLFITPTFFSQA